MQYADEWIMKTMERGESFDMHALLSLLAENRIPAVRISNFFSELERDRVVQNINRRNISWYRNSECRQGRIGISATEYCSKPDGKAQYFALVPESSRNRDDIFFGAPDPIRRIVELFSHECDVSVAREPTMGNAEYFSGLIRAMGAKSTLHFDYAPHQLPGWSVSESEEQFGLVLYLQMPANGGELLVYNRPWVLEDDAYNEDKVEKGPYGFNPSFLADERPTMIAPVAGDLIIFRSRNFHQVEEIEPGQYRLTFNSFLTRKNGALFLWS